MASKWVFCEEDFSCSVCYDIFKDPVLLPCGHSVCRSCIKQYWSYRDSKECPLCRKRCHKNPPANLALRDLSETFRELRGDPETLCDSHGETMKLYCADEARLVCVVCRESEKHQNHTFRPVDEMAAQMKIVLNSALEAMKVNLKNVQDSQFNTHRNMDHINRQAQNIRDQITGEFKKLNQFLRDEKTAMLNALREEEQQKTQRLNKTIEKINKEILSLCNTIREIGKELDSQDVHFIKNFETTLRKAQCTQTDPEPSTEVINVAKYIGNLQFRVWKKMQNIIKYTPVVLDPNTAHAQLILSTDLTSVRDSDDQEEESSSQSQQLSDSPERFERCLCVLGSKGFSSGKHSWEVEVENSTFWMLGVATESVRRKEHTVFPSEAWGIGYDNNCLCVRSPSQAYAPLSVATKPQVVRVDVDMDAGEVWFTDPLSGSVIHRFTHYFTEKVFPIFHSLCSLSPLKILPIEPYVCMRNRTYRKP